MKERTKGAKHSPAEKPLEVASEQRGTDRAQSARNGKKPLRDTVAMDPVVNEVMIRRIMAALMSPEQL
jgi:hypothetical protein